MLKNVFFTILMLILTISSFAQLKSGPMLGYSEMREVLIWIQTQKADKVKIGYWDIENPKVKFFTDEVLTTKDKSFSSKIIADQVLPSKKYGYEIYINGKLQIFSYPLLFQTQTLWQFRTDPPPFSFAFGSCVYVNEERFDRPGSPYGKDVSVFTEIAKQKPNFMLWGGDNVYLREADWLTKTGIYHRYTHTRSLPEMQALLASTHNYAVWDDHDFGANNSNRTWPTKDITLAAFKDFWGNLTYAFPNEAITGTFAWEDCQFFLMDDSWYRAPNEMVDSTRDYFGEKQLNWLIEALKSSNAPFKFVVNGGQIINPARIFENMSNYAVERRKLLDKIEENKISGVLFLTGDRHHTVIHKLDRENNYPLHDITVSPLTSGAAKLLAEEYSSKTVIPEKYVTDTQSFSLFEITGKRTDRQLKINIYNAKGEKLWDYSISAKELRAKKE
ncbi:MAG: alkaline phosphatase D family protein [Leadbetterella sp.]